VRTTPTRRDTVRFIMALYRFWTDKDLDEHKSHLAIYSPDLDRALAVPISDFRRTVAQLPGIGYRTSAAVEAAFGGSFRKMMRAGLDDWANLKTRSDDGSERKLGPARAKQIMEALK
jgi:hypothetical protein